jgi:RNA polymerase sigma-70 factor (ECF subfamily)
MAATETSERLVQLFRQWHSPVRRFLRTRSGVPSADIDDLAQEVFLRVMRYRKTERILNPQAYLFRTAANVAAEWSVRSRYRQPHESGWLAGLIGGEEPEECLRLRQSQDEVARALGTLSARQREILKLYFTEERDHAEIAARLGESVRSVRRCFTKSYARLRDELDSSLR